MCREKLSGWQGSDDEDCFRRDTSETDGDSTTQLSLCKTELTIQPLDLSVCAGFSASNVAYGEPSFIREALYS